MKKISENLLKFLCIGCICIGIVLFFSQRISLHTSDLGRHLTNGRLFVEDYIIPKINYYSYTQPDFPVVTHHWGAGVIYYLIFDFANFVGLSLFNIFIYFAAIVLLMVSQLREKRWFVFAVSTFLVLPLFAYRTDVRPESFSLLFLVIYIVGLQLHKNESTWRKSLWFLPLLQIAWVNLHIFFPFGICAVGLAFLRAYFHKKNAGAFLLLLLLTIGASFFNPFGVKGAVTPFIILKEYGYMVAENQSILFMFKRFGNPLFIYTLCTMVLAIICYAAAIIRNRKEWWQPIHLFAGAMLVLAVCMVRMIPFWGVFAVMSVTQSSKEIPSIAHKRVRFIIKLIILFVLSGIAFDSFSERNAFWSPFNSNNGLGVRAGTEGAAQFFNRTQIRGPIFNNYDIGGYIIFYHFPEERVFVDNRPESYSVEFFQKIYIPMQEDESVWQTMSEKYAFNAIYFYRHDATPWAQPFLIRRIRDPLWVPVYVDYATIILLKNTAQNADIIKQFQLPQHIFSVKRNG